MEKVKIIPRLHPETAAREASWYDLCGADEIFFDSRDCDQAEAVKIIKSIYRDADTPLNVLTKIRRFEDVKKLVYAGAKRVLIDFDQSPDADEVKEAVGRFGKDRVLGCFTAGDPEESLTLVSEAIEATGIGGVCLFGDPADMKLARTMDYISVQVSCPVGIFVRNPGVSSLADAVKATMASAVIWDAPADTDIMEVKQTLGEEKIPVYTFESAIPFEDFKLNSDGMVPCITQDYRTGEVLMLAYMNQESYEKTIASGKMTYYSRSQNELWTKGDTSGHYQYVKSLTIDCDKDTILAKVAQVGAACHTGNRTCFFTPLARKEYNAHNPLEVFEQVYETILDRKENPKEGSYTNYLFDQGIDKILKKCGEEATEIVIAAKNPDSDELKYEICDFLYHMMVLMANKNMTWKEITEELAQRH